MPLLDSLESFRSYQVENHEGVNSVPTLSENSIYQYSRTQTQRANEARQRISRKNERQLAIKDKESIDITISEDLADGQVAKFDSSLKLLGEDDLELLLPNDELGDDEIHIIETTINVPQHNTSFALQDYQMQLMLLEQQNKKRLFLARTESPQPPTQDDRMAAVRESQWAYETDAIKMNQGQVVVDQIPSQGLEATQVTPKVPSTSADKGTAPATKRRKRHHRPRTQLSETGNADAINGSDWNTVRAESVEHMPPHFVLLYNISCDQPDFNLHRHPVPAFYDAPVLDAPLNSEDPHCSAPWHLNGRDPVLDLQALMENDTDDIAFLIMRTVECSQASILTARASGPLRWTEAIYMKSKISKIVMHQVATCYFQPIPQETNNINNKHGSKSPSDATASFRQNRLDPADLFLFHHRHSLRDYAIEHYDSKQHIDALFQYMDTQYAKTFAAADNLFASGLVDEAHVLYLFRPNQIVISGTYGKPAAFVLQEWPKLSRDSWVTLVCWSFQADGSGFARKQSILSILPIGPNSMKIQDLAAYPLQFATPELQTLIRDRGVKQWELRTTTQITYKGWNVAKDQFFPDARFMIDHKIYHKMHQYAQAFTFKRPTRTHLFDRWPAYLEAEQEPPYLSLLLMPPDVHGFYLNEKKWINLYVDCVQPVSWNKKAFERLVLPPQTKDLVRALVTVRTSQRGVKQGLGVAGKRTDITSGKGNGLIMLLHGGPGTGKTLTGESVAEIAEMPLYRVTCGDIGTSAEGVEKYLNTVLHLGKTWNCVLLLDEADVFLEERSMADLKRNSLVSVFLRILEYYDGILILTSNRVGIFDEAFKSRIQVALHYENLNRSARKQIWQNFLEMLEEDEENVNFDEIKFHLDDLAGKELSGRQIRNVLTTARQLAIFRNERLDWEHLAQALSVSSDFNAYLKRMQGHTDDQRARDTGLR